MSNSWEQGFSDSQYRADLVQYFEQAIEQFEQFSDAIENIVEEYILNKEQKETIDASKQAVHHLLLQIKQDL